MSFTVNKLDVVFLQRNSDNSQYEQINISGSDAFFYLDSVGNLAAGKISDVLKIGGTTKSSLQSYQRPPIAGETMYSVDTVTIGKPGRLVKYQEDPNNPLSYRVTYTDTWTKDTPQGIGIGKTDEEPFVNATLDVSGNVIITGSLIVTNGIYPSNSENSVSASYALSSSVSDNSITSTSASYALSSSYCLSGSYFSYIYYNVTQSATYILSASYASGSTSASVSLFSYNSLSSSFASSSISSSYSLSSSYSTTSGFSASSSYAVTSSFSNKTISSSYASTASYIGNGVNNFVPKWNNNTLTNSSSIFDSASFIGINNQSPEGTLHIGNTGSLTSSVIISSQYSGSGFRNTSRLSFRSGLLDRFILETKQNSATSHDYLLNFSAISSSTIEWEPLITLKGLNKRVGIGTTDPQSTLHVFGPISSSFVYSSASYALVSNTSNGLTVNYVADITTGNSNLIIPTTPSSAAHYTISLNNQLSITGLTSSLLGTSSWSRNSISSSNSDLLGGLGSTYFQPKIVTGSIYPITSSVSISSSYALSASYAPGSVNISASYSLSASYSDRALSASYAPGNPSISASYALSASYSDKALSASYAPGNPSISASYALSASYSNTSSFTTGTASYSFTSSLASSSISLILSAYNISVLNASRSFWSTSSSFSSASVSSSYASTASYIGLGTNGYLPKWNNNSLTQTSLVYDDGTNVGIGTNNPIYSLTVRETSNSSILGMVVDNATSKYPGVLLVNGATAEGTFRLEQGPTSPHNVVIEAGSSGTSYVVLRASGSGKVMMIPGGTGSVGISTTEPRALLHVFGPISASSFGSGSFHGTSSYSISSSYSPPYKTSFDSINSLATSVFLINEGDFVLVRGYYSAGDWGETSRTAKYTTTYTGSTNLGNAFTASFGGHFLFDDRFEPRQNIKWWGAKGNGISDDYNSISASLSFSNHIDVPVGRYVYTTPISITTLNPISIKSKVGSYQSGYLNYNTNIREAEFVYKGSTTTASFDLTPIGGLRYGCDLENVSFDASGSSHYALKMSLLARGNFVNVRANNAINTNLFISASQFLYFDRFSTSKNDDTGATTPLYGVRLDDLCTANTFNQITVENSSVYGVYLGKNSLSNNFINGAIESNNGGGLFLSASAAQNTFDNIWFENNGIGSDDIHIDNFVYYNTFRSVLLNDDIDIIRISGSYNTFENCRFGNVYLSENASKNIFDNSYYATGYLELSPGLQYYRNFVNSAATVHKDEIPVYLTSELKIIDDGVIIRGDRLADNTQYFQITEDTFGHSFLGYSRQTGRKALTLGTTCSVSAGSSGNANVYLMTSGSNKSFLDEYGTFQPYVDDSYDLGTSSLKWRSVYANNLIGTASLSLSSSYSIPRQTVFDSINSLTTTDFVINEGDQISVRGYYSPGDWGDIRTAKYTTSYTGALNLGNAFTASFGGYFLFDDRYSETQNIKWWGAKGDGVTDDYTSISSSFAYSDNIELPLGRYIHSQPISIITVNPISIKSKAGSYQSGYLDYNDNVKEAEFVYKGPSTTSSFDLTPVGGLRYGCELENISFDASGSSQYALKCVYLARGFFKNVRANNATNTNLYISASQFLEFDRFSTSKNDDKVNTIAQYGIKLDGLCTANTFIQPTVENSSIYGLYLGNRSISNNFVNGAIESNGGGGIFITSSAAHNKFQNIWLEANNYSSSYIHIEPNTFFNSFDSIYINDYSGSVSVSGSYNKFENCIVGTMAFSPSAARNTMINCINRGLGTGSAFDITDSNNQNTYLNVINYSATQRKWIIGDNFTVSGSLFATSGVTSSLLGTASYAKTASYIGTGINSYIPAWNNNTLISASVIYNTGSNVGINNNSPAGMLHIGNLGTSTSSLILSSEYSASDFGSTSRLSFRSGLLDRFIIQTQQLSVASQDYLLDFQVISSSGASWNSLLTLKGNGERVGIGTTVPQAKLHVFGDISASFVFASASYAKSSSYLSSNYVEDIFNFDGNLDILPSPSRAAHYTIALHDQISITGITSSLYGTSSWSKNSIYSVTAGDSDTVDGLHASAFQPTLITGSTYPITCSWANNWNSSSLISLINSKQTVLGTGSTYPITSSWSNNSVSAESLNSNYVADISASSPNLILTNGTPAITGHPTISLNNQINIIGITGSLNGTASYSLISNTVITPNPGTGIDNYFPKWNSNALTPTSLIYDDGANVGIGTNTSSYKLTVQNEIADWVANTINVNNNAASYFSHGSGYGAYIDCGNNAGSATYALNVNKGGSTLFEVRGDGFVGINAAASSTGQLYINAKDASTNHLSVASGLTQTGTSTTYTFKGWWGIWFTTPSFNGGTSGQYFIPIYG